MVATDRRAPMVVSNRWSDLHPPDIGGWDPSLRVSVVMPYYERSEELGLTLAAMAHQTYPAHLFEVIVVDDGSPSDPPRIPGVLPFELTVLTQDDQGYGLARARNLGASRASGDVVVFLDCDMIPERQHLEAHARWHHLARLVVTIGFRRHADFAGVEASELEKAVLAGNVPEVLDGFTRPEWIEAHMNRTDLLRGHEDNHYAVMSGGNLGIDRELYFDAGGTDESFTRWGGEDNELGYRVLQLGALVVPERQAIAWHQGEGHEPSEEELAALRLQRPKLQDLIPDRSTRVYTPGRVYQRPLMTVFVEPGSRPAEEIGLTVDSVLASEPTDLVVGVGRPADADDAQWLRDTYQSEPRVSCDVSEQAFAAEHRFTPIHVRLPGGFAMNGETLGLIAQSMGGGGVGLLHFTLPGMPPSHEMGRVTLTRAEGRARALGANDDDDAAIGALFGERWASGASLGLWPIDDHDSARHLIRLQAIPSLAAFQAAELAATRQTLDQLTSRRSMLLADGLGSLVRARSAAEFRFAFSSLRGVVSRRPEPPSTGPNFEDLI